MAISNLDIADSMFRALGFQPAGTAPAPKTPEEICCGDPKNLDGDAHPWSEVELEGEQRGSWYRCQVCGAIDQD